MRYFFHAVNKYVKFFSHSLSLLVLHNPILDEETICLPFPFKISYKKTSIMVRNPNWDGRFTHWRCFYHTCFIYGNEKTSICFSSHISNIILDGSSDCQHPRWTVLSPHLTSHIKQQKCAIKSRGLPTFCTTQPLSAHVAQFSWFFLLSLIMLF